MTYEIGLDLWDWPGVSFLAFLARFAHSGAVPKPRGHSRSIRVLMASHQSVPKESVRPEYQDLPRDPGTNRPILPKPVPGGPAIKTKGQSNRLADEQREFARRVLTLGKEGGQEEYEANLRKRMMAGLLAPQLEVLVLHYMYGKPQETVVVKSKGPKTSPLAGLTAEELRLRALNVAQQILEANQAQESQDSPDPDDADDDLTH